MILPASRYGARPPIVRFGPVEALAEVASAHAAKRWMVVSDPGVVAGGGPGRVVTALRDLGLAASLWSDVRPDPAEADVARAAAYARELSVDGLIAVGGGSAIDTAKGVAFLLGLGGAMRDHVGHAAQRGELPPLLVAPTTAGTGSEAQSFALISRDGDHAKMACGHPGAMPRVVMLDAALLRTCPRGTRVAAGLDAFGHAIEASVSTATSDPACAARAFTLLWDGLQSWVDDPHADAPRRAVQEGSMLAGAAIEAGMLGAAHALANPLTMRLGVPHGLAVGALLGPVIACNDDGARYAPLGVSGEVLRARLDRWRTAWGARLVAREQIAAQRGELITLALSQWTGSFNPVPLTAERVGALYDQVIADG